MTPGGISTVFLDAGGVLVYPNWRLVSEALARHGVEVSPARLEAADPPTKRTLDVAPTVKATNDDQRGFLYFDLILKHAGVSPDAATDAALAELREYHERDGVWDYVPDDVMPALRRLRAANLELVVVSNSNGTLRKMFDRVGLLPLVDLVIDSGEEGIEKPDPAALSPRADALRRLPRHDDPHWRPLRDRHRRCEKRRAQGGAHRSGGPVRRRRLSPGRVSR